MVARNILIWNIESFGAWSTSRLGNPAGIRVTKLQFPFIAHLVQAYAIDVMVIQEFRPNGAGWLSVLQAQLPGAWDFDYIPGAVRTALPPPGGPAVTGAQLAYPRRANKEGYAVLWRTGTLDAFPTAQKLSHGLNGATTGAGFMRLVLRQLEVEANLNNVPPIDLSAPPNVIDARFPQNPTPPITPPRALKRRKVDPIQYIAQWQNTRRPCVMKIAGTGGGPPATLIVYHAPVNTPGSYYATLIAGSSEELHAPTGARAIIGGDFNMITPHHLNTGFNLMTYNNLEEMTHPGGADSWTIKDGFQRSSVRYRINNRAFPTPDQTLGSPRDQVLIGGDPALNADGVREGKVINVLADLTNGSSALAPLVFGDAAIQAQVRAAVAAGAPGGPPPALWGLTATAAAIPGIGPALNAPFAAANPAAYNNALTAAVFYRDFISDHLPVFARINV